MFEKLMLDLSYTSMSCSNKADPLIPSICSKDSIILFVDF